MAKFYPIRFDEMYNFLVHQGFKWLNPPKNRALPELIMPEGVAKNPSPEFYGIGGGPPTLEAVFGRRVFMQGSDKQLTLRIYTAIDAFGSRAKGSDAIRVTLFYRPVIDGQAKPPVLIGGERKCLRVEGWKANMQARIDKWPEMIGPACPKCGSPTVERDGKYGKFWGCVVWSRQGPQCGGAINFGQENVPHCVCGKKMYERRGRNGPFLSCSGYPACRETRDLPGVKAG